MLNTLAMSIRSVKHVNLIRQFSSTQRLCAAESYEIKEERLQEIAKSPSGWVARADPQYAFDIMRSRTNNLPVYVKHKGGGKTLTVTTVRKIRGDLKELERALRQRIGNDFHYQINELTSQIHIKGNHKDKIVRFLKELGF